MELEDSVEKEWEEAVKIGKEIYGSQEFFVIKKKINNYKYEFLYSTKQDGEKDG